MAEKIQILVADDATFIRDLLKKSIRTEFPNSEIAEANDGKRAISQLKKSQHFDLILCDWEMPEMSGEEVLKWARSTEKYAETQFIMVTSQGDKEYIVQAAEAGVSDFLIKPFKNEQLITKIKKALKKCGKLKQSQSGSSSFGRSGFAADSVSVLTKTMGTSYEPDFDAPPPPPKKKKPQKLTSGNLGKAEIRVNGFTLECLLESLTTKQAIALCKRLDDKIPPLLSPAVIDIVHPDDANNIARINAYIYKLECAEEGVESRFIHVGLKIVDEDGAKTAFLEEYIKKKSK